MPLPPGPSICTWKIAIIMMSSFIIPQNHHNFHNINLHPMVDVVCDPNVLEVRPVLLSSLAEVDVQVVQGDWWMGPGKYHCKTQDLCV